MIKRILLASAVSYIATVSANITAQDSGIYLGVGSGAAWSKVYDKTYASFALRTNIGIDFNRYCGTEFGWYFSPQKTQKSYTSDHSETSTITKDIVKKARVWGFDFMMKFTLPFDNLHTSLQNWSIFGKVGLAFFNSGIKYECWGDNISPDPNHDHEDKYKNWYHENDRNSDFTIHMNYSAGISYAFDKHFSLNIYWYGTFGRNRVRTNTFVGDAELYMRSPTVNAYLLGLQYKF